MSDLDIEKISVAEREAIERRLKAIDRTPAELVHAALGADISLGGCIVSELRYLSATLDRWERRRRKR